MATHFTQIPASIQPYSAASNQSVPSTTRFSLGSSVEASRPYLVPEKRTRVGSIGKTAFIALAKESEDARITGSTRSLDRRLLGLNLRGAKAPAKVTVDPLADIRSA